MKFSASTASVVSRQKPSHSYLKQPSHHSIYRVWLLYIGFLILYGVVFSVVHVEPVPYDVHIVGVFIAAVCFFPLTKWIAGNNRNSPMFELICIAYWMAFGLPLYTQRNAISIYSETHLFLWEQTFATLCVVLLGITSFVAGYYLLSRWRGWVLVRKLDLPLNPQRFTLYAKIAVGTGAFMIALQAANIQLPGGALAAFSRLLFSQIYVAIILLAYRTYTQTATLQEKPLLWFALAVAVLYGMATGVLEAVMIPLVLIFIVRWQVTRRLPVGWLTIGILTFFLLNSVKGEYRQQTWWSNQSLSFEQRIGIWVELSQNLVQETLQGKTSDEPITPWQKSLQRFDLLHQFIYIYEMTPRDVPYFNGSTYKYFFYGWIPRVLWPGKPAVSDVTTQLALTYKFLMPEQVSTTVIGIGLLPEAYLNFGVWGVLPILALQGIFLSVVGIMLNSPRSEGGNAIYLSIMIFFLNGVGTQTALLFSSIIPGIIGGAIILRPFARDWSATPKMSSNLRRFVPLSRNASSD